MQNLCMSMLGLLWGRVECSVLVLFFMLLGLYKTIFAYIENSFRALSRPPPAGFALMLGILDLNYLLFLIILLLSSTMLVLQRCI